jgi:poly(U)-specific endoribonuclease
VKLISPTLKIQVIKKKKNKIEKNMKPKLLLLGLFIVAFLSLGADAKKSSSSRRSGSNNRGSGYSSRTTSRPQTHTSGGSNSAPIGWNIPKQNSGSSHPQTSVPNTDSFHKTSATNVQSSGQSWKPSGGYNNQNAPQTNNHPYNPPNGGGGYNPPAGGGYNPSVGGGYNSHNTHNSQPYNPSYNQPHNPSYNPSYNSNPHSPSYPGHGQYPSAPPPYNPYNPSMGHSYSPGAGYNPPVGHAPQTILVQQAGQPYKPGIGQLAKEAFVYAGVSAGVNAAVNRILPGGISGHRHDYPSGGTATNNGVVPTVTHTQITYNNYYNNGTAIPAGEQNPTATAGQPAASGQPAAVAQPAPQPAAGPSAAAPAVIPIGQEEKKTNPTNTNQNEAPSSTPSSSPQNINNGLIISKDDMEKLTEDLMTKDTNNGFKFVTMNLQGQKMDDSVKDDAPEPLLVVKSDAYGIPTVQAVLTLHDNYELDVKTKENLTPEKRKEESDLLDQFLQTEVMKTTMKFLSDKGFIPNDEYEFKDSLKRIWFTQFKRIDGDPGSSGFETVFLAEKFDSEIIGMHNWIYYAKQEEAKKLNYLGYIKEKKLGTNGAIVKLRSTLNEVVQPVTTIFVGTSPELEMALYTICFFTNPNQPCPIKLGGTEFIIIANAFTYYGKDILISAYPEI